MESHSETPAPAHSSRHWLVFGMLALVRFLLAIVVGITSALAIVFSLNSPWPGGWATNSFVGITITTGIILFHLARMNLSATARMQLCVPLLVVSTSLCVLALSGGGPLMKDMLTLSILVAAASVGGTLAIAILRAGSLQNSLQTKAAFAEDD